MNALVHRVAMGVGGGSKRSRRDKSPQFAHNTKYIYIVWHPEREITNDGRQGVGAIAEELKVKSQTEVPGTHNVYKWFRLARRKVVASFLMSG